MKSIRYSYSRRPCFDRLGKRARQKLHKTFRSYTRQRIKTHGDFEPMPRRMSWG